jgi:hypothetical protein
VEGGQSVSSACSAVDALADWQFRTGQKSGNPNADGVVWFHDFESRAEVDQFRWTQQHQNDPADTGPRPNSVRWRGDDGVTNGCLEIWREPGSTDPSNWWRQFSPLDAQSNGRGVADPGAGGTIARKSFRPTSGGNQTSDWDGGYYGDPRYWSAHPGQFDGHDYYLQCRVKMDPNRIAGTNGTGGKLFYFTRTDRSLTSQEIVTISGRGVSGQNYFDMYRSGGGGMDQDAPGVSVHGNQPNTDYGSVGDGMCRYDNNGGRLANCWYWPAGQWATILYHVRNGTGTASSSDANTLLEVFVAKPGQTQYTRIWNQSSIDLPLDLVPGHNALICSAYMNGDALSINTGFYHRYCQIIFSKKFIPCPQA